MFKRTERGCSRMRHRLQRLTLISDDRNRDSGLLASVLVVAVVNQLMMRLTLPGLSSRVLRAFKCTKSYNRVPSQADGLRALLNPPKNRKPC